MRIEELVERAGFVEVAIDPSPVALSRALPAGTTFARRDAATDEAFDVVVAGVAGRGRLDRVDRSSAAGADGLRRADLDDGVRRAGRPGRHRRPGRARRSSNAPQLRATPTGRSQLGDVAYPPYPLHDIRAPTRQCVALGAAIGAAGLAGRIRPIDMTIPSDARRRPRSRSRGPSSRCRRCRREHTPRPVTPTKRLVGRIIPRRRR